MTGSFQRQLPPQPLQAHMQSQAGSEVGGSSKAFKSLYEAMDAEAWLEAKFLQSGNPSPGEGEMTVVIGRPARNVSEAEALDYVAGYTIANDGSVRDWQKRGPQVAPGKNWERSGMLGPWITTADEAGNPANMTLTTRINGEVRQQGSTADLVFSAAHLVSYISSFITLAPGDMITTGSPSGVAVGFDPPKWLVPGDKVEIEINTLGTLAAEVATF